METTFSGVKVKPDGPFSIEMVNLTSSGSVDVSIDKLISPSSELLHVSSFDWRVNVFCGIGLGSQTSPIPSSSRSDWSGFAVSGQLSSEFLIPSPSLSSENTIMFKEVCLKSLP